MHTPTASYRLQLNPSFGFRAAKEIVSYLDGLGISEIYASPIFKARRGSTHGYDIVDSTQLNPELGSVSDFEELVQERTRRGIGWIQDVVPNHMAFDHDNHMLMEVLENGPCPYFHFFDIEWNHVYESIRGRLLAPFLGRFYWESLENGEIQLRYHHAGFTINYYQLALPLKIESYLHVLTYQLGRLKRRLGGDHPDFVNFLGILYVLKTLSSEEDMGERYDQIKFIKTTLWELYAKNRDIHQFIDRNVEAFNGLKKSPESFNLLNDLLSEQLYRLSFWKVATEEINYRRFFNINHLICLRIEDEAVFKDTHSLFFNLIQEGKVTGLRVDHIDGLYDPATYLKRLRERAPETYLVVEKILDLGEELPLSWPVHGTTGYDFLNYVNGLFCQRKNEKEFSRLYMSFTDFDTPYDTLVGEKKRLVMGKHMAGDIDNLAHHLKAVSSKDRHGSDITIYGLKRALVEVMAQFPVYRTYIDPEGLTEADRLYMKTAIERAKQSSPGLLNELEFIERFLLLNFGDTVSEEEKNQWLQFVMRFQQFTGPLMAKGFEDTTLYVYNRLLSLNEVGGNPGKFGISLREFNAFNERRSSAWPQSLNATSTHDTKRGEDARARINVLSEIPREWERRIKTWSKINRNKKKKVNGRSVPDRNDEYFLYQTLVGAFPLPESDDSFLERIRSYTVKAVREAKVHTAWLKPDTAYEEAFVSFVEGILDPSPNNAFLGEFLPFQRKIAHYGILNSLSQTLLKITCPGVPDFYQGAELWDLSLVDPDNRRTVDFERRKAILYDLQKRARQDILGLADELLRASADGRIKLFLIHRALKARREHFRVFAQGSYIPVEVEGMRKEQLIPFARNTGKTWVVTMVPRFPTALVQEGGFPLGRELWANTEVVSSHLPDSRWRDLITDQVIEKAPPFLVGEVLKHFPVALLINEEER
jgi:(1->4)-alpha-D-glucan 1-alpha-D-glucosylmutase